MTVVAKADIRLVKASIQMGGTCTPVDATRVVEDLASQKASTTCLESGSVSHPKEAGCLEGALLLLKSTYHPLVQILSLRRRACRGTSLLETWLPLEAPLSPRTFAAPPGHASTPSYKINANTSKLSPNTSYSC